jgi:hypothetical protein
MPRGNRDHMPRLRLGSVGYEPKLESKRAALVRLAALRGPRESYSDVILRLALVG